MPLWGLRVWFDITLWFTSVLYVQLCSYCRFQPEAYLHLKRQLIQEHKRTGKLNLADARKLLKIDVNKTRKLYDLLVSKNLIAPN